MTAMTHQWDWCTLRDIISRVKARKFELFCNDEEFRLRCWLVKEKREYWKLVRTIGPVFLGSTCIGVTV